jgi:tRNA-modifying protein YgfZ
MTALLFAPIVVSGPDARAFLQGQLTCDLDLLDKDKPLLACVNSAQGRVQAVFEVQEQDDVVRLLVIASMAERTVQRLRKYVLRSKVKIDLANDDNENSTRFAGHDSLLETLRAGIPHVLPETYEAFVAQMLNLDMLGGISFEKGCYTGQEIIARAHFRGAVKRRMFRFALNGPPPAPGTRLLANKEHAGDVVYAAATESGSELLAVVSLAQAELALTLDQSRAVLERLPLPYTSEFVTRDA